SRNTPRAAASVKTWLRPVEVRLSFAFCSTCGSGRKVRPLPATNASCGVRTRPDASRECRTTSAATTPAATATTRIPARNRTRKRSALAGQLHVRDVGQALLQRLLGELHLRQPAMEVLVVGLHVEVPVARE